MLTEADHTRPMNADGTCPRGFTKRDGVCVRTSTLQAAGHEEEPESGHDDELEGPKSARGFTVAGEFAELERRGRKLSQEEANYVLPSPSPEKVCGACRFYLRNPDGSDLGLCQIVDGPIAWFATSDAYISAAAEAEAAFAKQAGEMSESIFEGIRPAFGSPGGKKALANLIVSVFPEHRKYVEPFVGGGAVFFAKERSMVEILNDKDRDIAEAYQFIRRVTEDEIGQMKKKPNRGSRETFEQIKASNPSSGPEKFHRFAYLKSFSKNDGRSYRSWNDGREMKMFDRLTGIRERLRNVEILCKDWKDVVQAHDGADVLFYLDPPYPGTADAFNEKADLSGLRETLKRLKGKFILSLSPKSGFDTTGFEVLKVKVRRHGNLNIGADEELLIANFSMKSEERIAAAVSPVVVEIIQRREFPFLEDLPDLGAAYFTERDRLEKTSA